MGLGQLPSAWEQGWGWASVFGCRLVGLGVRVGLGVGSSCLAAISRDSWEGRASQVRSCHRRARQRLTTTDVLSTCFGGMCRQQKEIP